MSENECDPVYGKVDDLLELLTKSKALHVLLELHLANRNLSFTDLKRRVDSASTTVSRRLTELEHSGFIEKKNDEFNSKSAYYSLTDKSRTLAQKESRMTGGGTARGTEDGGVWRRGGGLAHNRPPSIHCFQR